MERNVAGALDSEVLDLVFSTENPTYSGKAHDLRIEAELKMRWSIELRALLMASSLPLWSLNRRVKCMR